MVYPPIQLQKGSRKVVPLLCKLELNDDVDSYLPTRRLLSDTSLDSVHLCYLPEVFQLATFLLGLTSKMTTIPSTHGTRT